MAATALQRKIFSRWVSQKLLRSKVTVNDVVEDFHDGVALATLIEELSEQKLPGKALKTGLGRIQAVAQIDRALKFTWAQGVEIKLKPSAENLIDKDERAILGLVWGIMQRFLRFGDDEDEAKLSAEDALLMWVKNQTKKYDIEIKNFTKSFHSGVAFASLIHKFRPNLIDPASLGGNAEENLQKVFDAAQKYFDLDQYLKPSEIAQLDKKSAFIYVSEYYYGIAEQRKLDLAAKRICKLITFTEVNDKLKEEYKTAANGLKEILDRVTVTLNDRTIDNTMAGAKKRLAEFYEYRKNDKPPIIEYYFKLEQSYNHVAARLADHKRPKFEPGDGLTVPDFRKALVDLEATEKERSVALVAELNRQIKLVQLNSQHERLHSQLSAFISTKTAYLQTRETVESSGAANYHINVLKAFNDESAQVQGSTVVALNELGAELAKEKYENTDKVQAREAEVKAGFETLAAESKTKNEILIDHLGRNIYKEKHQLIARNHGAKFDVLKAWLADKEAYLSKKEEVDDVPTANLQIAILAAYKKDVETFQATQVPALQEMGKTVLDAKYETALSSWVYENPDDIKAKEQEVLDTLSGKLTDLHAAKKKTLEDDLAREIEKERLRLLFANQAAAFTSFTKSLAENISSAHFGFNLAEVEAYAAKRDAEDAKTAESVAAQQADYNKSFDDGAALGVKENVYTNFSKDDLAASAKALTDAQAARNEAYTKELERQRYNDKICKEFADIANPLVKTLDAKKDEVSTAEGSLEDQLAAVTAKVGENIGSAELPQLTEIQGKITEAGVENNPHTYYTLEDMQGRVEQFNTFLSKKQAQLEEEIRLAALKGLTPEQLQEIEDQFKEFDANKNNYLELKEFKACLFSLGEERPKSEVQALLGQYGDGGKIEYPGFKDFMITLFGVSDDQDEVVNGFKLIGKFEDFVTDEQLTNLMEEHFVNYIKNTAADGGKGKEYVEWTKTMFSR